MSSFTISEPCFTAEPESKWISRTSPGSSEPRMTARTATSVPMAWRVEAQLVSCTGAVLTASGGGANEAPALIMVLICRP